MVRSVGALIFCAVSLLRLDMQAAVDRSCASSDGMETGVGVQSEASIDLSPSGPRLRGLNAHAQAYAETNTSIDGTFMTEIDRNDQTGHVQEEEVMLMTRTMVSQDRRSAGLQA